MSKPTTREAARREARSVEQRLARLLDSPVLDRVVPHLAPETLHQLVQYRGLGACGDLITSATPAQLTALLDLDLWRQAQPASFDRAQGKRDERFDADRFGEWLEVLVDAGRSVAARTVAALDKHLVILGLCRYLRVFDPGTFEPTESSDDEPIDRNEKMNSETSADVPECEVGGYLVRARRADAWDAIVTLLVTLESEHNHYFHAVMQGCRSQSNSRPEIDGLDDLLMAPEQHLYDVASERARRQSRRGYATAADARAFLQMARQPRAASAPADAIANNPIATAYFRAVEEEADESATGVSPRAGDDVSRSVDAAIELLAEAADLLEGCGGHGLRPQRPRALLEAAGEDLSRARTADPRAAKLPLFSRLMEFVAHHDEAACLARSRELAFLANTLLAGCSVQSRAFTPREASDAAACICNLGLECWPFDSRDRVPAQDRRATSPGASSPHRAVDTAMPAGAFLVDHDLVSAFEVGWSVLYQDVSLFVADRLVSTLSDLQCADADIRRELYALQRQLVKQREAGTPWLARDAADVLAMLDITVWNSVLGLLDECPILPEALTAVIDGQTTSVSPTAFQFISTTAQIGAVRVFMRMLPGVLSR